MIPEYTPRKQMKHTVEIVNELSPVTRDEFDQLCQILEAGYKAHLEKQGEAPRKFGPLQSAELILSLIRCGFGDKLKGGE